MRMDRQTGTCMGRWEEKKDRMKERGRDTGREEVGKGGWA